jgi:hypothetical protein
MGVDILATLIDNALHHRSYAELPPSARWIFSAAALLLAWFVVRRGRAGATSKALWGLPLLLLALGYISLHSEVFFVDLTMPAAAVLTFLSAVKLHDALRCRLFGLRSQDNPGPHALACGASSEQSERVERIVLDTAAQWHLRVTGGRAVSGACASVHSLWVLWGLPSAQASSDSGRALTNALPGAWCRPFKVGPSPQQNLFQALADASPSQFEPSSTRPLEPAHAVT